MRCFSKHSACPDGAHRIAALVRTLPKDRPVALVLPADDSLSGRRRAVQCPLLAAPRAR